MQRNRPVPSNTNDHDIQNISRLYVVFLDPTTINFYPVLNDLLQQLISQYKRVEYTRGGVYKLTVNAEIFSLFFPEKTVDNVNENVLYVELTHSLIKVPSKNKPERYCVLEPLTINGIFFESTPQKQPSCREPNSYLFQAVGKPKRGAKRREWALYYRDAGNGLRLRKQSSDQVVCYPEDSISRQSFIGADYTLSCVLLGDGTFGFIVKSIGQINYVYGKLAYDGSKKRAVKFFKPRTPDSLCSIEHEYAMTAQIPRSHVKQPAVLFNNKIMAMKLIEGTNLYRFLHKRQQPLSFDTALDIAINLLIDLDMRFHSIGIAHGDLSAANIIIKPNNKVKIIDAGFSLDRKKIEERKKQKIGLPECTYLYMAPELFKPHIASLEGAKAADIYTAILHILSLMGSTWEKQFEIKEGRGRKKIEELKHSEQIDYYQNLFKDMNVPADIAFVFINICKRAMDIDLHIRPLLLHLIQSLEAIRLVSQNSALFSSPQARALFFHIFRKIFSNIGDAAFIRGSRRFFNDALTTFIKNDTLNTFIKSLLEHSKHFPPGNEQITKIFVHAFATMTRIKAIASCSTQQEINEKINWIYDEYSKLEQRLKCAQSSLESLQTHPEFAALNQDLALTLRLINQDIERLYKKIDKYLAQSDNNNNNNQEQKSPEVYSRLNKKLMRGLIRLETALTPIAEKFTLFSQHRNINNNNTIASERQSTTSRPI